MKELSAKTLADAMVACRQTSGYSVGVVLADKLNLENIKQEFEVAISSNSLPDVKVSGRQLDGIVFPNGSAIYFIALSSVMRGYRWHEVLYDRAIPELDRRIVLSKYEMPYLKFDTHREMSFSGTAEFNTELLSKYFGIQPDPQPEELDAALNEFISGI